MTCKRDSLLCTCLDELVCLRTGVRYCEHCCKLYQLSTKLWSNDCVEHTAVSPAFRPRLPILFVLFFWAPLFLMINLANCCAHEGWCLVLHEDPSCYWAQNTEAWYDITSFFPAESTAGGNKFVNGSDPAFFFDTMPVLPGTPIVRLMRFQADLPDV